jgi:hypothetical protein
MEKVLPKDVLTRNADTERPLQVNTGIRMNLLLRCLRQSIISFWS